MRNLAESQLLSVFLRRYKNRIRSSSSNSSPDRVRALVNMPSYKLYYFNVRGKAEICRLAFSAANIEFEDIRLSGEEWAKLKECELNSIPYETSDILFGPFNRVLRM